LATRVEHPLGPAWQRGKVASWLVTVDHKRIGILYIGRGALPSRSPGFLALLIRTQLAQPDGHVVTGDSYNEVVTMHGTGMVFFVMVPVLAGLGNFLVPLMIGAPDMAFPRLNALSYWLYAFAGLVFCFSFLAAGGAANTGWTAYPPLSLAAQGNGQDLWILSIHIMTLSSLAGAINFIVTIHNMRTRGMSWMRIPLFVWSIEIYAWLLLLVLPVLSAGLTMLLLERQFPRRSSSSGRRASPGRLTRSSSSTSSGSSGTRGLHHGLPGLRDHLRRSSPSSRASRSSATRRSRSRRSRSASSRCSCGRTTCSRSGCRRS
jgi:cytochrome c oxidase subunit 1